MTSWLVRYRSSPRHPASSCLAHSPVICRATLRSRLCSRRTHHSPKQPKASSVPGLIQGKGHFRGERCDSKSVCSRWAWRGVWRDSPSRLLVAGTVWSATHPLRTLAVVSRSGFIQRQALSAFEHVFSEEWPEIELGSMAPCRSTLKAARDPDRPTIKRISKVQKRLDALTEAVRRRAGERRSGRDLGE